MNTKYRVSLDVAKQLKEVGYPQDDCDAYWREWKLEKEEVILVDDIMRTSYNHDCREFALYAAPCVGRLGDAINTGEITTIKGANGYMCSIGNTYHSLTPVISEADARALMWLERKQRKLI